MARWKEGYNIYGLCDAAGDGRLEDVEKHLQNGVDVNGRGSCDGETPLYKAAEYGHLEVVKLLTSRGAKVNSRHDNGDTPLNRAMRGGHSPVVQFLLSKGATYDIRGLLEAAGDGRLEDVKEHIRNGVDINGSDWDYETPLCKAVSHNHWEIVDLLLSEGAHMDQDKELRSVIRNYEKTKKNTIAVLQKCITKAKNQKGKVSVRFIKILCTGSGAAGKTSFSNLLMKNKFIDFHHSTNIVQVKHAVSVKKAFVAELNQSHDQNIVWLEMDDDSQISHLREILLSLDVQSLSKTQINNEPNPLLQNKMPQLTVANPSNNHSINTQEAPVKEQFRSSSIGKRVTGWFQGSVKSDKLLSFNSLVQSSIMPNTTDQYFDLSGEVLNIITLLDTGGQPEYMHLLPTINIHPMVNFVIHDLSKSLGDQVLVEYSEHGKLVFEPYHLKYSNFDMIKFLMSSIGDSLEKASSQVPQLVVIPGKDKISYLCCVGTHADKVSPDIIHSVSSQLTATVEKLDCKAAIWHNKDHGVLFPVDNTTAGNEAKEDPIANFIRSKINQLGKDEDIYELPITWMLLELEIRKVCSDSGKAYMSFKECCSIAHQTNLIPNIKEVRSALIYHHYLGVLLYYPDVPGLCDYVITDHQWLFDRISSIVCFTFKQSSNLLAANSLKYNGILTKEMIQLLKWKEEIKEEYFFALLVEMKIIAPMQREDGNGEDYFIPYILPTYTVQPHCDDILSQYGCLQGEPLLIQFVSNLLPRGFFCCLAVEMLQRLPIGWHHVLNQKGTHHTYSNLITFCSQSSYYLSLMDKLSFLELQIRHQKSDYYNHCPIHIKIIDILDEVLKNVCEQLTFNYGRLRYGFHCQCGEYDDEHIAAHTRTPPFDYAQCRHGNITSTKLTKGHTIWLTKESHVTNTGSFNQLVYHNKFSDHQSAEYKIFTNYYSKLVDTLSVSDLSHYFVSEKIISLTDHEEIIRSLLPRGAAKLLLERVSFQLQKGNSRVLNNMLLIMDHHGVAAVKALSTEIRCKLSAVKSDVSVASSYVQAKSEVSSNPAVLEKTTTTELIKEEQISAEHEMFIHYYSQLVCCISAKALSPYFVTENIISDHDHQEILNVTSHIKAASLLLSKISFALKVNFNASFYKFLDITEQHGNIDSKTIATAIRKKLLDVKSEVQAIQLVRSKHDAILQCLPVDYEKTLQALQDHLSDEQICIVLSSSDYSSANKVMLDCLLVKMNCMGNLLEFCDQLGKILPLSTDEGLLTSIIAEFRRNYIATLPEDPAGEDSETNT